MTEMARHGTKRVVKEEYIERSKNEVLSELKARLALPRQCMTKVRNQLAGWVKGPNSTT